MSQHFELSGLEKSFGGCASVGFGRGLELP